MVGKVDQALQDLGIRDNTLLLFTCDNGTYTGITSPFRGRDYQGGKGTMPNAGTHVPLIAYWPEKMESGTVNNDLIDFSDFLPTLAELAGAKIPADRPIDGVSFAPQLRGEEGTPRDWVFCWYDRNGARRENVTKRSARTARYKLYHDGRFYDVPADELEKRNLDPTALDPAAQSTRKSLQAVLDGMAADKIEVELGKR
jgi:arylsulfatase A